MEHDNGPLMVVQVRINVNLQDQKDKLDKQAAENGLNIAENKIQVLKNTHANTLEVLQEQVPRGPPGTPREPPGSPREG